ncbi:MULTISPECIES: GNAT family N-acetyltransferase [unclassified Ruegeria]|uniref:GNAT family N-acetyltransferase n=2 Tax=Ruegeria TaxID=97050 RepID=UPI001584267C|nr:MULTISPECIES: GNAT family N-acetyltransferase [unclassified Ruegeria]
MAIRRATVFDAFGISQTLIRSITLLCVADHGNDADLLALWTRNKDPESVRNWLHSGAEIWVAERTGQIAAVGGLKDRDFVTLLYVDPAHVRLGVGQALLQRLEEELVGQGCSEAGLVATQTARAFYLRYGWTQSAAPEDWHGISQFPMRKSLQSAE